MRTSAVSLSLLALCLTRLAVPALAQQQHTIYDNNQVNGPVNARIITTGFAANDSSRHANGRDLPTGRSSGASQQCLGDSGMYENGPVNGQRYAWPINFGGAVTDTFTNINIGPDDIVGFSFWAWLIPGDSISYVELSIGSSPYGTDLFHGSVNPSQSDCFANHFRYNVCLESVNMTLYNFPLGTYWLTLQNAFDPFNNFVYWDQNSGAGCMSQGCPSLAKEALTPPTASGSIPSEAFTVCFNGEAGPSTTDRSSVPRTDGPPSHSE